MKLPTLVLCLTAALSSAHAALKTDIEYGVAAGESLKLDAYVPEGPGPFPAVILVHGGGWTSGDKSGGSQKGLMAPMHEPLEKGGYAWFSINYRLAPKHTFPAAVEDIEAAVRWVKAHATEYRIDPLRLALAGESAGAHLAAVAALRGDASTRVFAVVAFYGRFDLTTGLKPDEPLPENFAALTGHKVFDAAARAVLVEASPIFQARQTLPAFLFVHGSADKRAPYEQSVMMHEKLMNVGVPCEFITIPGGDHGMLGWPALAPNFKREVVAWLDATLLKPPVVLRDATARK